MSRNGSGTMTIPNTMVAGEVITASDHNENYSDIGAEITNSVAVDGQSTMTGPLKVANGTAAAPSVTFGSDTDSGLYRIGANNIGLALNGAKVADFSTAGLAITGTLSSSSVFTASSGIAVSANGIGVTGGVAITTGGLTLSADTIIVPTGSASAPTYSFASDSNSGFYRIGADNIGAAVNGAKVLDISATGLAITGTLSATGGITATNVAAQSDQETATSTTTFVSPGRQQHHPSAAKAWAFVPAAGGVTTGVNVSGVVLNSTGNYTLSFSTPFSSANYVCFITGDTNVVGYVASKLAGSVTYNIIVPNTGTGSSQIHQVICFGDQ